MEVADLRVKFSTDGVAQTRGDIASVDRGIRDVDHSARSAGGSLGTLFKVGAGFLLGAGILEGARGLLMLNANAEQAKISLETVTGSAAEANAIFKEIQQFAASTPFEFPELIQASINLEAFGMSTMEWLPTIGDTASAMGKSVDQVVQAVLDASTGQYERLKELGILARVEGDKLTFQYQKNGETITETVDKTNQELIQNTLMGIWNDKYDGAMERQSKTFIGQWSTLKDNVTMRLQEMTTGIFGFATGTLSFMNDVFSVGWQQAIDNAFGDSTFGNALSNIGTLVGGIIDAFGEGTPVSEIVKKLPESWQGVGSAILKVADAFGDLKSAYESGGISGLLGQLDDELKQIAEAGIDLGKIAVSATFELAGDLAGNAWEKIKAYAGFPNTRGAIEGAFNPFGGGTSSGPEVDIGSVLVAGTIKLIGDLANFGDAIDRELGLQVTEAELEASRQAGERAGKAFADATGDGIAAGFEAASNTDADGGDGGWWGKVKAVLVWEPPMFRDDEPTFIDKWVAYGSGLGSGIHKAVVSGLIGGFYGEGEQTSGVGAGSHVEGGTDGWKDRVIGFFTDIPGDIASGVGILSIDIPTPELPDWLTDFGWITEPIATLTGYIADLLGLKSTAEGLVAGPAPTGPTVAPLGTNIMPGGPDPEGNYPPGGPVPVQQFTTKLDLDTSLFDDKFPGVQTQLDNLGKTSHKATLDADTGPFAIAYTDVSTWGDAFDRATFEATFDADTGPAAIAYTSAFGWGQTWANTTFTARFSVDTSPLLAAVEVVRTAAQNISDLLPSSPAKKGPLARNVSFKYIADALEDSMGRMGDITSRGLSALMGPGISPNRLALAGSSGGQLVNHYHLEGAVVTSDLMRQIRQEVQSGAARVSGKVVTSRNLESSR